MNEFKLVPVEPTVEMVEAGLTARTCPRERYLAMLAAAPAVQWEPDVSELVEALEAIGRMSYADHSLFNAVLVARKALAASQPTEQQPDDSAAVRLDKQCREAVAAALGFIRGGDYAWSYLLQQIIDITSAAEQQPAPDVTALVEALEMMLEMVEMNGFGRDAAMDTARAALEAYCKGGES